MIKVTKYTQGHLYPTASFTWVERWRHGGVEARLDRKNEWKVKIQRGIGRQVAGRSEEGGEEGAERKVRREGREKGKREGVTSLVNVPNRWNLLLLQEPCWDYGAPLLFVSGPHGSCI